MPFVSQRPKLRLSASEIETLTRIQRSRTESVSRIERATILLSYHQGQTVSAIAKKLRTNRPKVERTIDRALQMGAIPSLDDLPRSGKPATISADARAWVLSLACQKPKELGYAAETWTTANLAKHIRKHCHQAGHPSLSKISKGTVSKILSKAEIRPHKIRYYVERRDPEFDVKMIQVLHVYKEVELLKTSQEQNIVILAYDEKPGIQAIDNVSPDLLPVPGKHPAITRDYEYRRLGTVSLLASMDLITGYIHGHVEDRHRSKEFIEHLKSLDAHYPKNVKIKIILDNHSAHVSKETKEYLKTVPNRFEFIFTPTHGSWLNIIETLFSKMTRSFLRGIRVESVKELKERIHLYLQEVNETPVVFKWKYKLDDISIVANAA
ncbi:IS630 family transposase [candidate division KSB1 bacterium]|nr:IS630 family transposase [candidate division KSB1 bacterium]NIS26770.1 IS630 family transposase [candidate division KSB1 bacterium]NIT73564.1 IS630 family transposase [candidate division KSB1 bacterium]NIU27427.1 IS630 family transposase [candidate division KSB1 bacterium]NIU93982.1 IS630 family transposase [candidate division KSB1 bacterium]